MIRKLLTISLLLICALTLFNRHTVANSLPVTGFSDQTPATPRPVAPQGTTSEISALDSEVDDLAVAFENPSTNFNLLTNIQDAITDPALQSFYDSLQTGANQPTGIYSANLFAYTVVQQSPSAPNWVDNNSNTVTQYYYAKLSKTNAFLAHNYLAGEKFSKLTKDAHLWVVWGDGKRKEYIVSEMHSFRALEPNSPNSNLIDLQTNEQLSPSDVHLRYYTNESKDNHIVLQTCISANGVSSWGRLIIIAQPVK